MLQSGERTVGRGDAAARVGEDAGEGERARVAGRLPTAAPSDEAEAASSEPGQSQSTPVVEQDLQQTQRTSLLDSRNMSYKVVFVLAALCLAQVSSRQRENVPLYQL